jgi:hypothetical protein
MIGPVTGLDLYIEIPSSFLNKMRAVLVKDGKGPVENLYIGEAPKATLGKGEVLVKDL